jgi:DNA-binding XRE family transcriptional regulator
MKRNGKSKPNLTLKALRVNKGLSRDDLARLAGASYPTIRMAEDLGHQPGPRIAFAIAEVLGVSVLDIWPIPGFDRSAVAA